MKFTIEEEKRGDVVRRVIASATDDTTGTRIELSFLADERHMLEEIVTACNAHDQLVAALETAFIALGRAGGNALNSEFRPAWESTRAALNDIK